MKIALYQPDYPKKYKETLKAMNSMVKAVKDCPANTDILVLPEYASCPGMSVLEEIKRHCREHNGPFLEAVKEGAKANHTAVCLNMPVEESDDRWFNRTYFIDKSGSVSAQYDKTHLSPVELDEFGLIPGESPVFVDFMDSVITFAVCFEMYFAEFFEKLAQGKPDIILSPSYQRSETRNVIVNQCMTRAVDTGSYLARCSYSMGSGSQNGGSSLVASPTGELLLDASSGTGLFLIEFNPAEKRMRPLAHGLGETQARKIVEDYRIPSLYRLNSSLRKPLSSFTYPRVCAHRGLSGLVPENTLPSFAAAVAMGADEIEFDIRLTKDNRMVVCHDPSVERVSDGTGEVSSFDFDQLMKLNAGRYMGWTGVKFAVPEDIFRLFGGRIIMNIHVYESGEDSFAVRELKRLIHKYDIAGYIYFAARKKEMAHCLKYAPEIERCMLECHDDTRDIVDIATEYGCRRVQHQYSENLPEIIKKASKAGMINNLFYEDDARSAVEMVKKGVDTILTNYADRIIPALK